MALRMEWFFFVVLAAFTLCFEFHQLWLLYDVGLLGILLYFGLRGRAHIVFVAGIIPFLYVMSRVVLSDVFIGVLSFWDTYKHLILLFYIAKFSQNHTSLRYYLFCRKMSFFLIALIFFQLLVAIWQHRAGYHFDNISGTLGNGSTHSLGYLSFVTLLAAFVCRYRWYWIVGLCVPFVFLNVEGENIGIFVIAFLSLLFYGVVHIEGKRGVGAIGVFVVVASAILILNFNGYFGEFGENFERRIETFFEFGGQTLDYSVARRNVALSYAYHLGGFFGSGAGHFSEIYGLVGSGTYYLENSQLNISEASHIVAEQGVIGFFLLIIVYLYLLRVLPLPKKMKLVVGVFFLMGLFYNRFLMDERSIFFSSLLLFFLVYRFGVDAKQRFRPKLGGCNSI